MLIRIMSDLHLEFGDFTVPPLADDKRTVLVLAGDIGLVHKSNLDRYFVPFLHRVNDHFHKVVLIVGNHEHYGGSFVKTVPVLRNRIVDEGLSNVVLLEKQDVVIDDVAFIGATLWTDCGNHSPFAPMLFNGMSDSRVIRTGPNESLPYERKFSAQASWTDHMHARQFIFKQIDAHKAENRTVVVVTHHGPSSQSIHSRFIGDDMNMFYVSDLSELILDTNPDLWIHGHTHFQFDYTIGQTRVIANPRGYDGHEDTSGFNETLVVEV